MRAVRAELEIDLVELNSQADHVHLLVTYPPTLAISTLVKPLNGCTAYAVRREYTGTLWSPSCLTVSRGGAPLSTITQYIGGQARPL